MAAKFAALARKDKEAKAREAAFAEREASLAARVKKAEAIEQAVAKRDENPLAVLEALGIDIEKFADGLIAGPPAKKDPTLSAVETLQKQIEELKKEREQEAARAAETRREQAVKRFQQEIADEVKKAADKFELINEKNAAGLVYKVIEQHYNDTEKEFGAGKGVLMPIADAAVIVEQALEQDLKTEVEFFGKSQAKKVQAALQAAGFSRAEAKKIADAAAASVAPPADEDPDRELTVDDWVKAAEGKTNMVLTNDITASLPNYRTVKDDQSDLQKAIELLKFGE